MRTISLRFANCYGPYCDHKTSVVAIFLKWAREGKPLIVYGDGNQTRDFIHVNDICQAISLALTVEDSEVPAQSPFGGVFQIASGGETTLNYLVQELKRVSGMDVPVNYQPERKGEIRRNYADITKARMLLGFEPTIKFEEGLYQLWQWSNATSGIE